MKTGEALPLAFWAPPPSAISICHSRGIVADASGIGNCWWTRGRGTSASDGPIRLATGPPLAARGLIGLPIPDIQHENPRDVSKGCLSTS
jgi:hypothetical protein